MGLSGRLATSGHTRVPVRVERPDGSVAAVTTADHDGSWAVDVPAGEYVVRPRWMEPFAASASTSPGAGLAPRTAGVVSHVAQANAAPADAGSVTWTVRHGDTAHSPIWAVLDADGTALDLTGWVVRAQARSAATAEAMVMEWTVGAGVSVGSATVDIDGAGTLVTTSTIQLHLDPGDYRWLPETFSGVFDVEIELPSATLGDPPLKRYTVVPDAAFQIVADVTRDDG